MTVWHKLPQYFLFNELTPDPSIIWIIHYQLGCIKWPPGQCITNTAWRGKRGLDDAASKMRHSEANDSTWIPSRVQERSSVYLSYLVTACLTTLCVIHAGTLVNNERERIWKEKVVVQFELQLQSEVKCNKVKWSAIKWSERSKWSGMRRSEVQYREGGNESLWKRFIGEVSDEKWRAGVKAWVN